MFLVSIENQQMFPVAVSSNDKCVRERLSGRERVFIALLNSQQLITLFVFDDHHAARLTITRSAAARKRRPLQRAVKRRRDVLAADDQGAPRTTAGSTGGT